jgi:peptidoglycan/LPS O-acetylase OafA/YrhL
VAYAGVLSYSLYIWQTFFLHVANPTPASRYPWNLVGLAAAALLSYYAVEQPSLRLRNRLQRSATGSNVTKAPQTQGAGN